MEPKSNANTRGGNPAVEAVGDVVTVRGRLALLGWPSLSSWARARGYERVTVRQTVTRWGERTDRTPHGGIARMLMRDLRQTLERGERPAASRTERRSGNVR